MDVANLSQKPEQVRPMETLGEGELAPTAEARRQRELAKIDQEWEVARQKYLVTNWRGRRSVPKLGLAMVIAFVGGMFGFTWMSVGAELVERTRDSGPVVVWNVLFALVGLAIATAFIGWGLYCHDRVQKYERALLEYEVRRAKVSPRR